MGRERYHRGGGRDRAFKPDDEGYLDGLPLKVADKAWYGGDTIVDSYNWSLYVGVVVPIRISEIFGAKTSKKDK